MVDLNLTPIPELHSSEEDVSCHVHDYSNESQLLDLNKELEDVASSEEYLQHEENLEQRQRETTII
ncbi:hypothetical protein DCAR_0626622 [Daucus carota subsp. sativus]|uniref:Uncharacterized protein n=1 Tax=Daucus carota subsp. sativus TaxID=79200 RepID=A0A161YHW5_DAUCS|nr:hypothetical protein DCAR_0626622 [Daucus carota subsp. sativus]